MLKRRLPTILFLVLTMFPTWGVAQQLVAQPIAPVLESDISITDLTANSATLQVTTSIGLACVVVYGTDENFGQLALDQNMGASAHQDHFVVMRGLDPNTVYRYRLQGSAPDGTFYASDVLSFRTPSAESQPDLGVNVATLERGAQIIEVSSEFGGNFAAQNALDGDVNTEWSSREDGNDAFITVELPQPVEVSGFGLWTRTMGSSAEISRFEVVNESGDVFGPFELPDASGSYRFEAAGEGQRFTFKVLDSSGGNTGVVELEVFSREE